MEHDGSKKRVMNQLRLAFLLGVLSALFATAGPVTAQAVDSASDPAAVAETQRVERECRNGRGEPEACGVYGYRLLNGFGVDKNDVESLRISRNACDRGAFFACNNVAVILRFSEAVPHDVPMAVQYLERGCDGDHAVSCLTLGYMRRDGLGIAVDVERARGHFNFACIHGAGEGCRMEGRIWADGVGGTQQNEGNAVTSFRIGCGRGDMESCALEGYMALMGRGIPQDGGLAVRQYLTACEGGVAFACENIESIRNAGTGFLGYAELMAREAQSIAFPPSLPAEQRYILASAALANGQTSLAVGAFETLAEEGLADANFILAQMFYTGQGVAMDRPRALRYFQRAANRQHPHAMYVLGQFNWYAIDMDWNPDWGIAMMRGAEEAGLAEAGPIWRQWQTERNAYFDGRDAANRQMAIESERSQAAADAANMARIWGLYSSSQNQQGNGQVCGTIYRNNQANHECMARETFDNYYNPNR